MLFYRVGQQPLVNDSCVRCAICYRVCPADNIRVTGLGVQFSDHCEVCYACLHNCPMNAIHMPDEKSTARFRNEHVLLKDIIAANEL
jgi:Pyruvate/2-oxoacid:ferredoxin oxidoreductase delta subunit